MSLWTGFKRYVKDGLDTDKQIEKSKKREKFNKQKAAELRSKKAVIDAEISLKPKTASKAQGWDDIVGINFGGK